MRLSMQNTQGEGIEADGLLLVRRTYRLPILNGTLTKRVTQVVEIQKGEARLPDKWVLACVYIGWLYYIPVFAVFPGENLDLVPIISDYLPKSKSYKEDSYIHYNCSGLKGSLTLMRSSENSKLGEMYFKSIVERLWRENDEPTEVDDFYFYLPDEEYERVMKVLNNELHRLVADLNANSANGESD